jgi:threonine dehydratase
MTEPLRLEDYVRRTLLARVYDVAVETPLEEMPQLSRRFRNRIWLKREDLQPVFSFKIRGAYNKVALLNREEQQKGVICASAGNHAQGLALSASKLGIRGTIVMPQTTPDIKVNAVKALGGHVVLHGDSFDEGPPPSPTSSHARKATASSIPMTTWMSLPGKAPSAWKSCASTTVPLMRFSYRWAAAD